MFGLLCLGASLAAAALPAHASPQVRRADQEAAREGRIQGKWLPLRDIEARVVPAMTRKGAQYIGFDFDSATGIYTLKFLRNGNVIWVDVDARSGRVMGQSGG
ncbi:hypothetical protein OK349_07925 [Sphingomonas sp. BT-65]|uniref:hypothetical protein n=1 Tax=Sphingomonas sp. BT-65 TaxID=2989821 RepID=UPI0022360029|nr:hypothetical protein [Sphingomonas sp. BT-65]MCW4461633.1 hypothetical protein [Sphingomonas sp. BT-65]